MLNIKFKLLSSEWHYEMLGQICYCINAWSYSFSCWKQMFSDMTLFSATPQSLKCILWKAFSDYPAHVFMVKEQLLVTSWQNKKWYYSTGVLHHCFFQDISIHMRYYFFYFIKNAHKHGVKSAQTMLLVWHHGGSHHSAHRLDIWTSSTWNV